MITSYINIPIQLDLMKYEKNMFRPFAVYVALFTIVLTLLYADVAKAQDSKTPAYPPYVKLLVDQGVQVRYLGKGLGLDTWLTARNGQVQYVYVTPNQEANIVGVLIDRNGKLITADQLSVFAQQNPESFKNFAATAIPGVKEALEKQEDSSTEEAQKVDTPNEPSAENFAKTLKKTDTASSPAEKLYADIETTNWFEVGKAHAPLVYAVIDPDCTHCHRLIQTLRQDKAYEKGQIRTRLVPVGIMSGDALYRAGTLLSLPDKEKTFFAHIDGDEKALPVDEEATLGAVTKNMTFLQNWNLDVTPFLVYRSKDGSLKIVRGVPKDMDAFLKDIGKNG